MNTELLILGANAAGLSAASRARKLAPRLPITVLDRGPAASYSACGLPYVLSGRLASLDALLTHPPDYFRDRRGLDLRLGHEALELEPARGRVLVRDAAGAESWLHFEHLVLATGAVPRWRPRPLRNLFAANTWSDVAALEAALRSGEIRRVAIVGGGYIGLETAEALRRRGLAVTLVDAHASLLRTFDPELTASLPDRLAALGIEVRLNTCVLGLSGAEGARVLGLETSDGLIPADAVLNCAGLRPNSGLARAAGLALGVSDAIRVDDRQQTSHPAILAAGDCAETRHLLTAAPLWMPLALPANHQGRIAGINASFRTLHGAPARFPGTLATLAVPLAGLEWGRTGLSLDQARAAGYPAAAEEVAAASQASYLDPLPITVRLIYDTASRRALGVQFRGAPGTVAARLDAAAAALAGRLDLERIEMLDSAYQPSMAPLYEALAIAAHNAREH